MTDPAQSQWKSKDNLLTYDKAYRAAPCFTGSAKYLVLQQTWANMLQNKI